MNNLEINNPMLHLNHSWQAQLKESLLNKKLEEKEDYLQ